MSIISTIIYTLGNGIAFNLVLPLFAVWVEVAKLVGLM